MGVYLPADLVTVTNLTVSQQKWVGLNLVADLVKGTKSASQQICWQKLEGGEICRQKYPGISASFEQIFLVTPAERMNTEVFHERPISDRNIKQSYNCLPDTLFRYLV